MLPADTGLAGDTGEAGEATLTGEAGLAGLGGDATDAGVAGETGDATLTGDAGEAALTGDDGLSMLVAVGAGATSGDDATGGDGTLATVDVGAEATVDVGAEATVVEVATVDVVVLIGDDTDEIRCSVSRSSTSRGMSLGCAADAIAKPPRPTPARVPLTAAIFQLTRLIGCSSFRGGTLPSSAAGMWGS